jgi:Golgi nucleoside diphosphatase
MILSLAKKFIIFYTFISFYLLLYLANAGDSIAISAYTTKGIIIDAGSGGSRLHIYNWKPRIFKSVPPEISYPTTDEHWTARMSPGISTFTTIAEISLHLAPLIDFAINTLVTQENEFGKIPIYFKATGGMRLLPDINKENIMSIIRDLLSKKSFCPFFFQHDMARVISGEEEAIFSWAGVNFLMGTLILQSQGTGEANPKNGTFGTLDLGDIIYIYSYIILYIILIF